MSRPVTYEEDDAETAGEAPRPLPPPPPRRRRSETGLDRLRRAEARLDVALSQSYDRFSRGEITARVMDVERNELIRGFNRSVRAENIRYWSMLRRELPT